MEAINRANVGDLETAVSNQRRLIEKITKNEIPCVFISYQKNDHDFALSVARFLKSKNIDIYFDEKDKDLKFARQIGDPKMVTNSIIKGINESNHMLVIVSFNTSLSQWVPFEIGFAYEKVNDLKIIRHKGLNKSTLPEYLKTTEILNGMLDLDNYVNSINRNNKLNEVIIKTKTFSASSTVASDQLKNYLDT